MRQALDQREAAQQPARVQVHDGQAVPEVSDQRIRRFHVLGGQVRTQPAQQVCTRATE